MCKPTRLKIMNLWVFINKKQQKSN